MAESLQQEDPMADADNARQATAIRQYDILMKQNRFEHTSYWSRFGFMLISQMALLGFFMSILASAFNSDRVFESALCLPLAIVGLVLLYYFRRLHLITGWWIHRWLDLIVQHEEAAFGDAQIVRGANDKAQMEVGSVRRTAMKLIAVLTWIWIAGVVGILMLLAFQLGASR
jgi:hypothetical protein